MCVSSPAIHCNTQDLLVKLLGLVGLHDAELSCQGSSTELLDLRVVVGRSLVPVEVGHLLRERVQPAWGNKVWDDCWFAQGHGEHSEDQGTTESKHWILEGMGNQRGQGSDTIGVEGCDIQRAK